MPGFFFFPVFSLETLKDVELINLFPGNRLWVYWIVMSGRNSNIRLRYFPTSFPLVLWIICPYKCVELKGPRPITNMSLQLQWPRKKKIISCRRLGTTFILTDELGWILIYASGVTIYREIFKPGFINTPAVFDNWEDIGLPIRYANPAKTKF